MARNGAIASVLAVAVAGCSTPPPPPASASSVPTATAEPSPSVSVTRTPTMDELIALYEAEGLECEAGEYAANDLYGGMAFVACDGPVGDAELLVEARYGNDDELDMLGAQEIPGLNDVDPVAEREAELGFRTVISIPYPGRGTEAAERDLLMALNDPGCLQDECQLGFDGGHWTFRRWHHGGWLVRLLLDGGGR